MPAVASKLHTISVKEGELPVIEEPVNKWEKRVLLLPLALLLTEAFMEVSSFQLFAVAWIIGLLIAAGLSGVKLAIVKLLDKKLRSTMRMWKKVALTVATLAITFTVGIVLGVFRNIYLEKSGIEVPNGPIAFAFVSLLFFGGAAAAEYVLHRLRQRVALQRQYDGIMAQLEGLKEKLNTAQKELDLLRAEKDRILAARVQTMEKNDRLLDGIEEEFTATARQAMGRYRIYRTGRSNGNGAHDYSKVPFPTVVDATDYSRLKNQQQP